MSMGRERKEEQKEPIFKKQMTPACTYVNALFKAKNASFQWSYAEPYDYYMNIPQKEDECIKILKDKGIILKDAKITEIELSDSQIQAAEEALSSIKFGKYKIWLVGNRKDFMYPDKDKKVSCEINVEQKDQFESLLKELDLPQANIRTLNGKIIYTINEMDIQNKIAQAQRAVVLPIFFLLRQALSNVEEKPTKIEILSCAAFRNGFMPLLSSRSELGRGSDNLSCPAFNCHLQPNSLQRLEILMNEFNKVRSSYGLAIKELLLKTWNFNPRLSSWFGPVDSQNDTPLPVMCHTFDLEDLAILTANSPFRYDPSLSKEERAKELKQSVGLFPSPIINLIMSHEENIILIPEKVKKFLESKIDPKTGEMILESQDLDKLNEMLKGINLQPYPVKKADGPNFI